MEKKTKSTTITAILLILLILIVAFGIWAWARYSSLLIGNGTAAVAKWEFGSNTTLENVSLANASFNNVASGKIAPGTRGKFDIILNAGSSDVSVNYEILLSNFKNKPTNLKFYKDSGYTSLATASGSNIKYTGTIAHNASSKKVTVSIYWDWPYQTSGNAINYKVNNVAITSNDEVDTIEGKAAQNCTFNINITGTQATPTAK